MLVSISFLFFLILTLVHVIVLPVAKKRPAIISGLEGSILLFFFLAFLSSFVNPYIYIICTLTVIVFFFSDTWIIYGVDKNKVLAAFQKASSATRSTNTILNEDIEINNTMILKVRNIHKKITYVKLRKHGVSKKTDLTIVVFRKFIQNYFIE